MRSRKSERVAQVRRQQKEKKMMNIKMELKMKEGEGRRVWCAYSPRRGAG
jgi:hypothetical protein